MSAARTLPDERSSRAPSGPRWTCDDDCGCIHATYAAAVRHADRRGSVPIELPDTRRVTS